MKPEATSLSIGPASPRGLALAVDAGLVCVMLGATLLSGSLTLLGETIRTTLLLVRELADHTTRTKLRAGSLAHYEFGAGKLQQALNLAIALAMVLAGLWLAGLAFDLIVIAEGIPTPRGFAIAATTLALVTLRNGLGVLALLRTPEDRRTPIDRVQLKSSAVRFASLLVLQLLMTLAALTNDPLIALLADFIGAAFIALVLTVAGARISIDALLDLVDHPLNPREEAHIVRLLRDAGIEDQEVLDLRSRRSSHHTFVELTIAAADTASFEETRQRMKRLRRDLKSGRNDLDIAIKLRVPKA